VAALVLEDGGSEDEAIARAAARLVEDHPREGHTEEEIRLLFGERVLKIVLGCTDHSPTPSPLEETQDRLPQSPGFRSRRHPAGVGGRQAPQRPRVLHDYRHQGERLWRRFNAGKKDQLWYTAAWSRSQEGRRRPGTLVRELERVVFELEQAVSDGKM